MTEHEDSSLDQLNLTLRSQEKKNV